MSNLFKLALNVGVSSYLLIKMEKFELFIVYILLGLTSGLNNITDDIPTKDKWYKFNRTLELMTSIVVLWYAVLKLKEYSMS